MHILKILLPYLIHNFYLSLIKKHYKLTICRTIQTMKAYVYTNSVFTATYLVTLGLVILNNELFSKPVYFALIEGDPNFIFHLSSPKQMSSDILSNNFRAIMLFDFSSKC